jgi:hypothetical protein
MAILPSVRALILGGADTLEADKAAALELFEPDLIIACNHAARDEAGRVDHWVSMHPELVPKWAVARARAGHPPAANYWHPRHKRASLPSNPIKSVGGSSGMLCLMVARQLHVTHAVLAGVPMAKMNRHYDNREPWYEARQYHPAWLRHREQFAPWVRSMSGWTREQFGAPTEEWLNGDASRTS